MKDGAIVRNGVVKLFDLRLAPSTAGWKYNFSLLVFSVDKQPIRRLPNIAGTICIPGEPALQPT